jgi:hypothetical protein
MEKNKTSNHALREPTIFLQARDAALQSAIKQQILPRTLSRRRSNGNLPAVNDTQIIRLRLSILPVSKTLLSSTTPPQTNRLRDSFRRLFYDHDANPITHENPDGARAEVLS